MHPGWIVLLALPLFGVTSAMVAVVYATRRGVAAIGALRDEVRSARAEAREDAAATHERLDVLEVATKARGVPRGSAGGTGNHPAL